MGSRKHLQDNTKAINKNKIYIKSSTTIQHDKSQNQAQRLYVYICPLYPQTVVYCSAAFALTPPWLHQSVSSILPGSVASPVSLQCFEEESLRILGHSQNDRPKGSNCPSSSDSKHDQIVCSFPEIIGVHSIK